jgi:hypothetical protein
MGMDGRIQFMKEVKGVRERKKRTNQCPGAQTV